MSEHALIGHLFYKLNSSHERIKALGDERDETIKALRDERDETITALRDERDKYKRQAETPSDELQRQRILQFLIENTDQMRENIVEYRKKAGVGMHEGGYSAGQTPDVELMQGVTESSSLLDTLVPPKLVYLIRMLQERGDERDRLETIRKQGETMRKKQTLRNNKRKADQLADGVANGAVPVVDQMEVDEVNQQVCVYMRICAYRIVVCVWKCIRRVCVCVSVCV
jgi:arsenate reductase-like glutaredoxin family protein